MPRSSWPFVCLLLSLGSHCLCWERESHFQWQVKTGVPRCSRLELPWVSVPTEGGNPHCTVFIPLNSCPKYLSHSTFFKGAQVLGRAKSLKETNQRCGECVLMPDRMQVRWSWRILELWSTCPPSQYIPHSPRLGGF